MNQFLVIGYQFSVFDRSKSGGAVLNALKTED